MLRKSLKENYIDRGWHRFGGKLLRAGLEYVYLTRFSAWCQVHGAISHYNDYFNPQPVHQPRMTAYEKLVEHEKLNAQPVDYLEFGVGTGASMRWWTQTNRFAESLFVGFDPSQSPLPKVQDPRVSYQAGLFQKTLPLFLKNYEPKNRKLIHMHADAYSATLFALIHLGPVLRPGDLLMFDKFSHVLAEFRAFSEFVAAYPLQYKLLVAVNNYGHVTIEVTG